MLSETEIARLAGMGNALRPDWRADSLATHLRNHHATRAYRDLAVALAYVATDEQTHTPARLKEAGPWWRTTEEQRARPVGVPPRCPAHPENAVTRCQPCSDITPATPEQIAQARAHARTIAHTNRKDHS